MALKRGFAPVAFDELAWQDDLRRASKSARRIGEETRSRLERGAGRGCPIRLRRGGEGWHQPPRLREGLHPAARRSAWPLDDSEVTLSIYAQVM